MHGSKPAPSPALAVSVNEAARRLGVSRNTVYRLIDDGTIPAKKLRTRTVIEVSDLKNYLANLPGYTGAV